MILVDTSVWVDHFRSSLVDLVELLEAELVLQHPMVTAEIALGSLRARGHTTLALNQLLQARITDSDQLLEFIEQNRLHGTGIGLVDAQLLACSHTAGAQLWTKDKRLKAQAEKLGCAFSPNA